MDGRADLSTLNRMVLAESQGAGGRAADRPDRKRATHGARRAFALTALAAAGLIGCGAKTGLRVPDAGRPRPDAGVPTRPDAGLTPDAGPCVPAQLSLTRRGSKTIFVIDRSNSMDDTLDGREAPLPGELTRWQLLRNALSTTLAGADPRLEIGAKFFPRARFGAGATNQACSVSAGIDLLPAPDNAASLLAFFDATEPRGGTPTAVALDQVRSFFFAEGERPQPRFAVLATDGGPNCNPAAGVPPDRCLCTGAPEDCRGGGPVSALNCIDENRTLGVIEALSQLGVPVYVIGIDDPTRPDLADVLDRMAVAGGRPRDVVGERRFYSIRRPGDLRMALDVITANIAQCVLRAVPAPNPQGEVTLAIDGTIVPFDPSRTNGWAFTGSDRGEITLFGAACTLATGGAAIRGTQACLTSARP